MAAAAIEIAEAPARREHTIRERLPGADAIRAIAVLGVFLVHLITVLGGGQPRWLMECCRAGTDLFLVLSGCLIHRSLQQQPRYREFLWRRFLRIYPTFAVVLTVYVTVLFPLLPGNSKLPASPGDAIALVLGNVAILPMAFGLRPIITVSWSLSYICLFYILLPPVLRCLRGRQAGVRVAVWTAITLATFVSVGRPVLLPLGVLLSKLVSRGNAPRWAPLLFVGFVARALPWDPHVRLACSAAAAFGFSWWALLRMPRARVFQAVSRISYSFYLTHGLVILAVACLPIPVWFGAPLSLAGALGVAVLVYRTVEAPLSPLSSAAGVDVGRKGRSCVQVERRAVMSREYRFDGPKWQARSDS